MTLVGNFFDLELLQALGTCRNSPKMIYVAIWAIPAILSMIDSCLRNIALGLFRLQVYDNVCQFLVELNSKALLECAMGS